MQLKIAAKPLVVSCHLANANEDFAIPPSIRLLWCLLSSDEFKKLPVKRRRPRALPLMRIFKRQMLKAPSADDEQQQQHSLLFGHDLSQLCVGDLPCPPIMVSETIAFYRKPIAEVRNITCHMASQSVTCLRPDTGEHTPP